MRRTIWGFAFVMLVGCADKAQPAYDRCVIDEAAGKLDQAALDCETAVKMDPNSTSGKAAAEKLAAMQPALVTAKEASAAAAKADDERKAKVAAQAAADAKCTRWTTICTLGRHPDGSEKTTGAQTFDSKAKCEGIGAAAGLKCDPCRCRD